MWHHEQQAVNPKQLLALPPLHPDGYMPEDNYSAEEMAMVKD